MKPPTRFGPSNQMERRAFVGLVGGAWTEDRNIRIVTRWAGADADKARAFAKELVGMMW